LQLLPDLRKPRNPVKGTMTKPDAENTAAALVDATGIAGSKSAEPPVHPAAPPNPTNAKTEKIHVSPDRLLRFSIAGRVETPR
jgi:hypothetical protein